MLAVHNFCLGASLLALSVVGCDGIQPVEPSAQPLFGAAKTPSSTNAVAVSESRIDVYWQDNSPNETGFEVHRSTSGSEGTFTLQATTGANVTSYGDEGLAASPEYCYKVRAFQTSGRKTSYSAFSNTACATTPALPALAAPSGTDAKPANSTTVDVTWIDSSSAEDGFEIERSTDGGRTFVSAGTTGPNVTAFSDGGRTPNFQVCYRVVAFNASDRSAPSNLDCTTPPAGPTQLTAAKVDPQTIQVTWKDNAWTEDGHEVQRSDAEAGPFGTIANLVANSTLYRESVPSGAVYWYRVRATGGGGFSDFSNTAGATDEPAPPEAPSGTNVTPWQGRLHVGWLDNSTNEEGFRVERSTDGGASWATAGTNGVNDATFEEVGVDEQEFCYRVVAFNGMGDSPPSNVACATPPAPPSNLTATTVDHQAIDLEWTDNSKVEDAYEVQRADESSMWWFGTIAVLPANTTSYRDSGLESGMEYVYQVRALQDVNGFSSTSNQASATTGPAPAND